MKMITAKDYIDKIFWDVNCSPQDFTIFYLDHTEKELKEVSFKDIIFEEDTCFFFTVLETEDDGPIFRNIPYHRVRKITEQGKTVWERDNHIGDTL